MEALIPGLLKVATAICRNRNTETPSLNAGLELLEEGIDV
jgi:hypothetical protein